MAGDAQTPDESKREERAARLPGFWIVWSGLALLLVATVVIAIRNPAWRFDANPEPMPDMRLDLNTASAAELTVLPGIGPNLSERIVADRSANGPFASLDDLQRVSGIGERTVESIAPYVVVTDE